MRSLLTAYAVLALLAAPAALWAADAPPGAPPSSPPVEPAQPAASPPPEPAKPAATPRKRDSADATPTVAEAPAPVAVAAASGGVTIQGFAFRPATIAIDQGDTVTWTNRDGVAHSATSDDGSFDTGLIEKGRGAAHTFQRAGTFSYHCTPHPDMTATVVVRAASKPRAGGGGSGSDSAGGSNQAAATPAAPAPATSGSTLPSTGLDAALLALGGLLALAGGAALRRRLAR
jgi:plastocyanin